MRKFLFAIAALAAGAALAYRYGLRPWVRSWGIVPEDVSAVLPGDEIVAEATTTETRSITIDAAPQTVWPWLVQMGFGRGGWYSYDPMDMSGTSSDAILPEFQTLAVGDVVPTHPGGGFLVKLLEPNRSLVLYSDTQMVQQEIAEARASGANSGTVAIEAKNMSGEASLPDFTATWAFVLEPLPSGRTRLIERFRVHFGESDQPWTRTLPLVGFGLFMLMRKQMLGIKRRAEAGGPVREAVAPRA